MTRYERNTGVKGTSAPLMFKVHAISSRAVRISAFTFLRFMSSCINSTLSCQDSPIIVHCCYNSFFFGYNFNFMANSERYNSLYAGSNDESVLMIGLKLLNHCSVRPCRVGITCLRILCPECTAGQWDMVAVDLPKLCPLNFQSLPSVLCFLFLKISRRKACWFCF